jgi:hypothetical protein
VSDEHVAADMSAPSVMMNRERRLTIMTGTQSTMGGRPSSPGRCTQSEPGHRPGVSSGRGAPAMLRPPAAADHRRPSQIDGAPRQGRHGRPGLRGIVEQQGLRPAQPCTYCLRSFR